MGLQQKRDLVGCRIVRNYQRVETQRLAPVSIALLVAGGLLAGCSGATEFSSELLSKDAQWFSRPARLFIKNVSIETPPLTPDKPVTAEDLVSADGACPGMVPGPADANAQSGAPAPSTSGTVALGHTECDVVRGIGAPDSVNLSNDASGDRVAVVNYSRGQRAGIYTFKAGRLASIERVPQAAEPPKSSKPKSHKKQASARQSG